MADANPPPAGQDQPKASSKLRKRKSRPNPAPPRKQRKITNEPVAKQRKSNQKAVDNKNAEHVSSAPSDELPDASDASDTSDIKNDLVTSNTRSKKKVAARKLNSKDAEQWRTILGVERESLLRHNDTMLSLLASGYSDLTCAHASTEWKDLQERLKDIHSLPRLFEKYTHIYPQYTGKGSVISAIELITTSLNNCAVRQGIPVKFCWTHPSQEGDSALFVAWEAWRVDERVRWMTMTPGLRVEACSMFGSTILKGSDAMQILYFKDYSPRTDKLWIASTNLSTPEEALICSKKGQCNTSEDLLSFLRELYDESGEKERWETLQRAALMDIEKARRRSMKRANTFQTRNSVRASFGRGRRA